jgi:hypothetical protein
LLHIIDIEKPPENFAKYKIIFKKRTWYFERPNPDYVAGTESKETLLDEIISNYSPQDDFYIESISTSVSLSIQRK